MKILLVEDDEKLSYSLAFQLKKEGFLVDTCLDGEDAMYYMEESTYDLILLDRMLPHIDGITLLKQFREKMHTTPVIILTALGEVEDKITGLDSGADDYLVKPFAFEELMARIRCLNRRPRAMSNPDVLTFEDVKYSPVDNMLIGSIGNCTLSKREGELLECLLRNQNTTLPRMMLLTKVWGVDANIEDGNLDNYIHFLRRRLKIVSTQVMIKTIRGIGYRLEKRNGDTDVS